jgi:hypothetical protein
MRHLLITLVLLQLPVVAHAEVMVGQSAEWLAHSSDLIAKATPLEVRTTRGPGQVWFTEVRYRLDEVLKGPASDGDVLTVYDYSMDRADPLDLDGASTKVRLLLLFAAVSKDRHREIEGKFVVTVQDSPRSVFFLDQAVKKIYTPDSQRVTTIEDLVSRVRAQVAQEEEFRRMYPNGRIERESKESPWDSPALRDLYSGSSVFVWVPAYRNGK